MWNVINNVIMLTRINFHDQPLQSIEEPFNLTFNRFLGLSIS